MGAVEWLVISIILLTILVLMAVGRGREAHVGRLPREGMPEYPVPPADDGGHKGSFTRPPDVERGPNDERNP